MLKRPASVPADRERFGNPITSYLDMRQVIQCRTWSKSRGNRLPARSYPAGTPVHVNVSAFRRQPVFGKAELASIVFELVATHPQTIAACLMPDHLHWLLADGMEMITCVGRLKSYSTTIAWQQGHCGRLWQRSFWDHVVRKDEDLFRVAQYIIENPVRKGLVQEARSYPYKVLRPDRIQTP